MSAPLAPYAGTRALVLGGSGFIGRWVSHALAITGADVTISARDPERATDVLARQGVDARVLPGALRRERDVRALIERAAPAVVFNLMGYGVDRRERDDAEMMLINRDVVRWIAESIAETPAGAWTGIRLVHAGSALEYGAVDGDLDESVSGRPTESYGRSKLAGTDALSDVIARTGLRGVTARLFTVYGDGEHEGRLLPSLLHAAEAREPLALSGGQQRRDFTYVRDVAEGLLRLGAASVPCETIVNVATGRITSVREFVEIAAGVLALDAHLLRFGALPSRPEEMPHARVATERLRRVTGWTPRTSIAAGVRDTRDFRDAASRATTPRGSSDSQPGAFV